MLSILLFFLGNLLEMVADVFHRHLRISSSLTLSENSSVEIVFYAKKKKKKDLR